MVIICAGFKEFIPVLIGLGNPLLHRFSIGIRLRGSFLLRSSLPGILLPALLDPILDLLVIVALVAAATLCDRHGQPLLRVENILLAALHNGLGAIRPVNDRGRRSKDNVLDSSGVRSRSALLTRIEPSITNTQITTPDQRSDHPGEM